MFDTFSIRSLREPVPVSSSTPILIAKASPSPAPVQDQFISPAVEPVVKKAKPKDYAWVVDVAGVAGAVAGGLAFGPAGVVIGGALVSSLAVPLRRYLAARADREALEQGLSLTTELAVTAGSSLLFGAIFMGASAGARIVGTRIASAVAARTAAKIAEKTVLKSVAEKILIPAKKAYVRNHLVLRAGGGALAVNDLVKNKEGKFDPNNRSLDTGWGFAGALYSTNYIFGRFFGTNIWGLDVAAPMSVAAYQLFRVYGGASPGDFGDFNYNEAYRFRYIAEFGNILQSAAVYGRAYFRPDLRAQIAAQRGLTASTQTGTATVSPFGWFMDKTWIPIYNHAVPDFLKRVVCPFVYYPQGSLLSSHGPMAERLTIIKEFKGGDMMKPIYGHAGRLASLAQTWAVIVPYQVFGAPLAGMSRGEWGPNRYWKMTAWSLMGAPVKSGLGGDTPAAQASGFLIGLVMDAIVSQWYNPRYKKKHWAADFHETLARYEQEPDHRAELGGYLIDKIYHRQMTDWNLKSLLLGNGLRVFNEDYMETWREEVAHLTPLERKNLEEIFRL